MKKPPERLLGGLLRIANERLTLTGFEPALRFVDDVDSTFTADDAAVAMAALERAE